MITGLNYFYDSQQPRFLEQIVRAFSGFQYMTGYGRNGEAPKLMMVPARMALNNRMTATIIANASENTLNTVPMITVFQTDLQPRFEDLQNQAHVDTRQVVEREIVNGEYTGKRGKSYTVERLMPLPYTMKVQVDIWTSTMDQKYQLSEQILMAIGQSFEIQNSENPLDWTALTVAYVEDVRLSSRSIPIGSSDELDIMTITLRVPIWLSPPAKVKQQNLIEQIVTNINDASPLPGAITDASQGDRLSQSVVTPGQHSVKIENGKVTLLGPNGSETDAEGNSYSWSNLIQSMGVMRPAMSQLAISTTADVESLKIIGTIQQDTAPNVLHWIIDGDTLPGNTLAPVDAVIEPLRTFPGQGLDAAVNGQRYLILDDIGPSVAWGSITAKAGNIIQYQNDAWVVSYSGSSPNEYVLNMKSSSQLRWNGFDWVMAIDGEYPPGMWRLWL